VHEINGQKYVNHKAEGFPADFIGKKRCRNFLLGTWKGYHPTLQEK